MGGVQGKEEFHIVPGRGAAGENGPVAEGFTFCVELTGESMRQGVPPIKTMDAADQPAEAQILLVEVLAFVGQHHVPWGWIPVAGVVRKQQDGTAASRGTGAGNRT